MHSKDSSQSQLASSYTSIPGARAAESGLTPPASHNRKKAVGFAPAPPPYHPLKQQATPKNTVHLNSTDGLVVVSAFLPVILHRSDEGVWTADWDYEVLLSMQTHLRVTRVGIVKWRGWHGHHGRAGSPEAGVPFSERGLVEECLRPFNCVPVWVEPRLFGEM
jgi:trehalose 6-phosphate synthase/phosphatase